MVAKRVQLKGLIRGACLCVPLGFILTSTSCLAGDLFAPTAPVANTGASYENRVAKLEELVSKAMEQMEKSADGKNAAKGEAHGKDYSLPPAPMKKSNSDISLSSQVVVAGKAPEEEERVLGEMNGHEIFVLSGVIQKRPLLESQKSKASGFAEVKR